MFKIYYSYDKINIENILFDIINIVIKGKDNMKIELVKKGDPSVYKITYDDDNVKIDENNIIYQDEYQVVIEIDKIYWLKDRNSNEKSLF